MRKHRICLLGGTGFVGRHLVTHLARQGHSLRVLTRRRERHRNLLVVPTLELVETNIHYVSDLSSHFKGCDAVINLVGVLNDGKAPEDKLEAMHVDLPGKVTAARVLETGQPVVVKTADNGSCIIHLPKGGAPSPVPVIALDVNP